MQASGAEDDVLVTFYCKDPGSGAGPDCPAVYRTSRQSWVAQGEECGDRMIAQLVALKPTETSVELPDALVDLFVRKYVEERYGVDLGTAQGAPAERCP